MPIRLFTCAALAICLASCTTTVAPVVDAGMDATDAAICDDVSAEYVARAIRLTRLVVSSPAFGACLKTSARHYIPCGGDPTVAAGDRWRLLYGAAQLASERFDLDACRPGVLALPDVVHTEERDAFVELVASMRRELELPACRGNFPWADGCRRPYPQALARLGGRILHHRLHALGFGHGIALEQHDCFISVEDHDGNGRLDDCVDGTDRALALVDLDGDGFYDEDDDGEAPVNLARVACGLDANDPPYLVQTNSATRIVADCVVSVLSDTVDTCVAPGHDGQPADGALENACGDEGLLLLDTHVSRTTCSCQPGPRDMLGVFARVEDGTTRAIADTRTMPTTWPIGPRTRVVAVGDFIAGAREELAIIDEAALRIVGVSEDGRLDELAMMPIDATTQGLLVVGALRVAPGGLDMLVARRTENDGTRIELVLLDPAAGFATRATWRSGTLLDGKRLQSAPIDAFIGDVSAAPGEELVFENDDALLVVGVDVAPAAAFRVRASASGGGFAQSGFYREQDRIVDLVDLDGDGREGVLVVGVNGMSILGVTGVTGGESFAPEVVVPSGAQWGAFTYLGTDEAHGALDVDGAPGDELLIVRRPETGKATLIVLGLVENVRTPRFAATELGEFLFDGAFSIDARGDFDGDGDGDLLVHRFRYEFLLFAEPVIELAIFDGNGSGGFALGPKWLASGLVDTWVLRNDDVPVAAGRLVSPSRDAFVLAR